jgi:tetratricopeptide (TPR) repeat protein
LELPATQTRFLVSILFAARELYCEAIEQLQDLYTTMKEPAVVRMLGDLYAKIGLNREAEKKYLEALSLTSTGDLEGRGATHRSLAQVYEHLGSVEKAIVQLQEAEKAYRRLGNRAMVNSLVRDELRLRPPRNRR